MNITEYLWPFKILDTIETKHFFQCRYSYKVVLYISIPGLVIESESFSPILASIVWSTSLLLIVEIVRCKAPFKVVFSSFCPGLL